MNFAQYCSPIIQAFRQVPLRQVLVVPFVLQIFLAVGLTGWVSLRNGQKAVNDLAGQLRHRASAEIAHHLEDQLSLPQQINQLNLNAIEIGVIDLKDFDCLGRTFWKQMKIFPVGYVNFANPQGEFIGVERLEDGSLLINERSQKLGGNEKLHVYTTNVKGDRTQLIEAKPYNPLIEAWYVDAFKSGKPLWSAIYQWDDKPEVVSISASYPIYNRDHQFQGVIGVDLILSQFSEFLRHLNITPHSKTIILERNGFLVASSSQEESYKIVNGLAQRLKATESKDPLIRITAHHLIKQFHSLNTITTHHQLDFFIPNERLFVDITPWQDNLGVDWLIVVIVPESDFMGQIYANTRTTILLCLLALALATLLGLMTARWITHPIRQIAAASRAIANGDLDQTIQVNGIDELEVLAQSFNQMAAQLKASFTELEDRVAQRTAELAEARDAAETASKAKSQFLAQISHELRTPLNAILGFTQVMQYDASFPELHQEHVKIMHRNGERLLSLINDIITVANIKTKDQHRWSEYLDQTLELRSQIAHDALDDLPQQRLSRDLNQLPSAWIDQLYQAAIKGSDDAILQLLEQIPPSHSLLADQLRVWVNDFRFDEFIDLINLTRTHQ